jgi:serine/threonine protein phosphatase PrpC
MITLRMDDNQNSSRDPQSADRALDKKAFDYAIATDAGRVRKNNEDKAGAAPEMYLFVLCDGMGGLEAGERASALAVETVLAEVGIASKTAQPSAEGLSAAIEHANEKIFKLAHDSGLKAGMGSTIVAVQFHGERAIIAHVGDSRVYRLRRAEFSQVTDDHSFVAEQVRRGILTPEEASRSQLQNILIRALGVEPTVLVTATEELLLDGDTFLLCSDGLTRELSDSQIAGVLGEADSAQDAVDTLVRLANEAGGEDNITAIVIRSGKSRGGVRKTIGKWFKNSDETV